MSENKFVTLKDIAQEAGVSLMTVSRALRNQSNLSAETKARIQAIAARLGYRPNPLVSALMSYRRSAKPVRYNLSLAFITNFTSREGWRQSKINYEFFQGAAASADRHGYKLEEFWLREPKMTAQRMSQILYSRNINGLLIAPLSVAQGHLRLDWDKFSAVTIGYSLAKPLLHRAVNHQFRSLRLALRRLRKRGYQRIGLALRASFDERVDHNWIGGFLVDQQRAKAVDRVPLLVVRDKEWTEEAFHLWFTTHRPEVVISQHEEVLDWMAKLGVKVPEQAGFVHLNCPDTTGRVAGIIQHNQAVGAAAMDYLVGMIHRNERGIPQLPHSILVEGTWQDGQTLLLR